MLILAVSAAPGQSDGACSVGAGEDREHLSYEGGMIPRLWVLRAPEADCYSVMRRHNSYKLRFVTHSVKASLGS